MRLFGGMRERKQAQLCCLQTVKGLDIGKVMKGRLSRDRIVSGKTESKYHINRGGAINGGREVSRRGKNL